MTHQCPRPECSRKVPDDMFACRGDWYALPAVIRQAISATWRAHDRTGHLAATAEAIEWYRRNPPAYARREGMAQRYVREQR